VGDDNNSWSSCTFNLDRVEIASYSIKRKTKFYDVIEKLTEERKEIISFSSLIS